MSCSASFPVGGIGRDDAIAEYAALMTEQGR